MTTQDQEFTNSPEATPPAARSTESPPAKRRGFSMRGFTSLLLTMLFLVMAVSGTMLFLTPRGRVANWTGWTLLGLDKDQWGALHIMVGILFVIIAGLHLYLNWSLFLSYLKKKAVAGLNMKRELAVATVVAVLLLVGTIADVRPFSSIMALNDDIKDYWEEWAAEAPAPVPHAEELTLVEFSDQINLSLGELTEALQEEGFTVDNSELTVGEVGRQKGVSPNDVLTAIQKHHPEAGASHGGRGFGGGRGQGFGRGWGGDGCDEDDSSNDRGSRTESTHQPRSDDAEEARGMGLGGGGGFGAGQGRGQGQGMGQGQGQGRGEGMGQGQGRGEGMGQGQGRGEGQGQGRGEGQGQGMGMGRGRDEGFGAGSGFGGRSSSAEPSADEASKHSSSDGSGKLKGRTIVEKGKSITVEGALKQYGDEWQLVSESGIHNIHLGPEEYQESQGIEIEEGMKAVVTGFSIEEDIAVCSMEISGKTYVFRNKDGRPAWAGGGQGQGRNRRTDR